MRIPLLFHGFQVSRGRASVCLTMRYREGSRMRCGGVCGLGGGALMAVRARVRVQGEATVYRDPFTLSRFSSVPRSHECMPHDAVSRRFTNALRGRCGLGGGALMAVRARVRVQGEATVYRDPFTLSRFSSVPRSLELVCRKPVSRKFPSALRGRLPSRRRRPACVFRMRASAGGGHCLRGSLYSFTVLKCPEVARVGLSQISVAKVHGCAAGRVRSRRQCAEFCPRTRASAGGGHCLRESFYSYTVFKHPEVG